MPTILRADGFKFFFFANDHAPMHIHVEKGDDYAKIEFMTGSVIESDMSPKDLKKAAEICLANKELFRRSWDEWFKDR